MNHAWYWCALPAFAGWVLFFQTAESTTMIFSGIGVVLSTATEQLFGNFSWKEKFHDFNIAIYKNSVAFGVTWLIISVFI